MSAPMQILIAEDELLIRNSLSIVIAAQPDMKLVGTADNGLDALRLIVLHQPDLVLMDIHMPGLNGIECIRRLRAQSYAGILLIMTATGDADSIQEGIACGANGYVLKTPNFRQMLQTIRAAGNGQFIVP